MRTTFGLCADATLVSSKQAAAAKKDVILRLRTMFPLLLTCELTG
jgi:hypothetical protein